MRSLLITGGTGSLGRAVVAAVLAGGIYERVVVFSRDEFKQAMMQAECQDARVRFFLGDVRDPERLRRALVGVTDVVHAAALKWVASGAYNTDELFRTNFDGTRHVIDAATERGVERVLLISSDKGCHASNAYGASKFAAEQYAVGANAFAFPRGTKVGCARYGNVLWSRGSVAYRFRAASLQGRLPFRLTDRRMTRFGMRLSEAARFVLGCLGQLRGGEIFVPLLPSFRVEDVASAIYHAGRPAHEPVPLAVTGLRAGGEKLHETLLTEEESRRAVVPPGQVMRHYVIEPDTMSWGREPWAGDPIAEGWSYTSDKGGEWLSEAELIETFRAEMPRPLAAV